MVESFAASEDLGFIALTLRAGGEIWLAAASIYAVESDPKEAFTLVKTMGEPIAVLETPRVIYDTIEAIQRNAQHRSERRAVEEFVDFITENEIDVNGVRDSPITLLESDDRMKEIRKRGLAANDLLTKEEAEALEKEQEKTRKRQALLQTMENLGLSTEEVREIVAPEEKPSTSSGDDYDALNDEQFAQRLTEIGLDQHEIDNALAHRRSTRLDQVADREFGSDLGSVMDEMRQRDEEGDRG